MPTPPPPTRPRSYADARPLLSLRPMGNTTLHHRRFRLALLDDRAAIDLLRPVNLDLGVGAVLDLPDGDVAVAARDLTSWRVTLDEVLEHLLADGPGEHTVRATGPVWHLTGPRFVASVLLRPHRLPDLPLPGAPVIVVPTAGDLLLAGSDDQEALVALADLARSVVTRSPDVPGSALPLVRESDEWSLFEPPTAAEHAFCDLARAWAVARYADQQALLRAHYERLGADCYVAGVEMIDRDGRPVAVTAVTDGAPTVIPMADEVRLVRLDDRSGATVDVVPFGDLMAAPGVLTRIPRTLPPMYRLQRFPDELVRPGSDPADPADPAQ